MRERARSLARRERQVSTQGVSGLELRLIDAEAALDAAFQAARGANGGESRLEPAAEWLLDNFYLIKGQVKEIRAGLPRAYWRELPALDVGDGEREPRVLRAMRELLADRGGFVDVDDVREFVAAYQETSRLTLGELWAIPLMLRLALLERLRPLADSVVQRLKDTELAGEWADRVLQMARDNPANLVLAVADMARARQPLSPAWVSEFQRRMQGGNPALSLALVWLEEQLAARHTNITGAMEQESRSLAASQVEISASITSMRRIGQSDWSRVVEALSAVEQQLRLDPAGVYAAMDFATRDHYRHVVEAMARRCTRVEWDVAAHAVALGAEALAAGDDERRCHVGYWLVGAGRDRLEHELGVQQPLMLRWLRWRRRHPLLDYIGLIVVLTLAFAVLGVPGLREFGGIDAVLMALALVIAASHVSVAVANWLITLSIPPEKVCRLALEQGIPDRLRTVVAVPCMLTSEADIAELVAALEIRQLANRDDNLYFALLADFTDADAEEVAGDVVLLQAATTAIEALNARHATGEAPRFCLFLRPRRWNPCERVWMGRERKRGKIADLNRFLRGHDHAMQLLIGDAGTLRGSRYVIVLDADTELPPLAARRLVATLAHPLNQPRVDRASRRVVEGHGILQPRMSVGLTSESASLYARLFSEEIGLDPYTHTVSDVYQDLFGDASFVGKGIYDIDAFAATTGTRFPDNLILSHDLLEGSYARAGLVSDVELFERQPNHYAADMRRRHRWIRGDWQILSWLLPWVPGPRGRWLRNPLTAHLRWKVLDNLRRSVVPLALVYLLVAGWLISTQPLYWTLIGLGAAFASPVLISIRHLLVRNPRMEWRVHLRLQLEGSYRRLQQTALFVTMLPYEAMHHLDAIARSVWRMFISRRHLLQWLPASIADRRAGDGLLWHYRLMWTAPLLSLLVLGALVLFGRGLAAWLAAGPLLALWLASPAIARHISLPHEPGSAAPLGAADRAFLGTVARRTWHFFEHFVDARGNHLPPDNHQEFPVAATARRTSPTNIGMYLASALSAWDFGYITVPELFDRVHATIDSLEKMARHRGHFYNWYDIDSLEPLLPRYVSTVDSGNLIGCLLVLARGLEMTDESRLLPLQAWRGLGDTWRVFAAAAQPDEVTREAVENLLRSPPATLAAAVVALNALQAQVAALAPAESEAADWWQALKAQIEAWQQELNAVAPWVGQMTTDHDARTASVRERLAGNPSWRRTVRLGAGLLSAQHATTASPWLNSLRAAVEEIEARGDQARALASRCRALAQADFAFLCREPQSLLAIGYDVDRHSLDEGVYDLLASEARLAVYVAIAQGQLPRRYWFALGRLLTIAAGRPALVSWSGSMFEYLMPLLLMPTFDNTLLGRSVRAIVARQISYGREHGVPWGISESGYNISDAHLIYQYRAFGVPGLGIKRGLGDDLVIAPYASALATLINAEAAARNLQELAQLGALGAYGFHEALDYTPERVPDGASFALVRSFMAHHQGMTLAAISAALNKQPLQRRFLREPMFRANQILLQEKVPAVLSIDADTLSPEQPLRPAQPIVGDSTISELDTSVPQLQLLSNGHYHVVVSQTGGGYSQWGELAVNPWQPDPVRDARGIFCYVQDLDRNRLWSNTWQPLCAGSDYRAHFAPARAEFLRRDHGIETHTRIAVSTEDDVELRRITVTNQSGVRRRLALCSYFEWALARQSDVAAHPAFDKLFVQTDFVPGPGAILAWRRPRNAAEQSPVYVHLLAPVGNGPVSAASCETRRDAFLGRTGSVQQPMALAPQLPLANGVGAVLDPVAALRRVVTLEPGYSISVDLVVGVAADRAAALALAERYADGRFGRRVFDLAWTHEQVVAHQLNVGTSDRKLYTRLASSVLCADPDWRLHRHRGEPATGQSGLWKFGISGDLPIVVVRVRDRSHMPLVHQALRAHVYWQMHGLTVDLMIWNEEAGGYRQELQDSIMGLIGASVEAPVLDRPGGVFVRRAEHITADDRVLLLAVARVVLDGARGSMAEQMPAQRRTSVAPTLKVRVADPSPPLPVPTPPLRRYNGYGGFSADGREYVIGVEPGRRTPRPWCNVLANPVFGSVISEAGAAYSFATNAREFRLTPWHNDALADSSGEAVYLRDDDRGVYWSPTPWPVSGGACEVRHGFGYSIHAMQREDIRSTQTVFVAAREPIRITLLELHNEGDEERNLSVYGYVEWVLGEQRERMAPHIRTRAGDDGREIYAGNLFNDAFATRVAFFATDDAVAFSADRASFIGRNRSLAAPAALGHAELDGAVGAGIDPCAALQQRVRLAPGERVELVFVLGAGNDDGHARQLVRQFADVAAARAELELVATGWRERVERIVIDSPDEATNLLVNGWLAYQVIASRLWARSGFYQSGGAYGFRDQLQDSIALLPFDSSHARDQILRAAARQFSAGDVQHWWHPPHGRGVRTRISDDYLWLPWALAQYLEVTGDDGILDVQVPFLEGRELAAGEESWYDFADQGAMGSVYEHARRAVLRGLHVGRHGLPLIGSGDWNDGMNHLGLEGRGESVWLAFFQIDVMRRFTVLAARRGDQELVSRCHEETVKLAQNIEEHAWDGAWYRRAWADDGTVVGSRESEECRIDSLPQSWATLTATGSPERRAQALDSVLAHLYRPEARLLQLFDPPFDRGALDPGYIKGYVPGIRENGGQYTHAATWFGIACATAGRAQAAWDVFELLNPLNHTADEAGVAIYQAEPYVIAADVYWNAAHRGRGGWSWYTGSAGWMLSYALESLLGLRVAHGRLGLKPCLPPSWNQCRLRYRHGRSTYAIEIQRGEGHGAGLWLDGRHVPEDDVPLVDDGAVHDLRLVLPPA